MSYIDPARMLRENEGVRAFAYRCSQGKLTVGVGFNLDRPDAKKIIGYLGVNFAALRAGTVGLSDQQITRLLVGELSVCIADLENADVDFNEQPGPVQLVLIDMRYQLGPKGFRQFRNTLAAVKARDYAAAAAGIRQSLLCKQTPERAEKNAKILEKTRSTS